MDQRHSQRARLQVRFGSELAPRFDQHLRDLREPVGLTANELGERAPLDGEGLSCGC
jgi:hypothetical protein